MVNPDDAPNIKGDPNFLVNVTWGSWLLCGGDQKLKKVIAILIHTEVYITTTLHAHLLTSAI